MKKLLILFLLITLIILGGCRRNPSPPTTTTPDTTTTTVPDTTTTTPDTTTTTVPDTITTTPDTTTTTVPDTTTTTPDTGYEKVPVLMIHGLNGDSTNFDTMIDRLIESSYEKDLLFTMDLVPNDATCSQEHIDQITNKVEEIVKKTGFERVDLISHSNGGTDAMNYMRYSNGIDRVRNWISIGGANSFTCQLKLGKNPPKDETPGDQTLYTSIYSSDDRIVPNSVSNLQGAKNIEINGVSHINLLFDEKTFEYILKGLKGMGSNNN